MCWHKDNEIKQQITYSTKENLHFKFLYKQKEKPDNNDDKEKKKKRYLDGYNNCLLSNNSFDILFQIARKDNFLN